MLNTLTKKTFSKYILRILNFFYKVSLIIGIYSFIITISFYIDFIDITGYNLDKVIEINLFVILVIISRNFIVYVLFRNSCENF